MPDTTPHRSVERTTFVQRQLPFAASVAALAILAFVFLPDVVLGGQFLTGIALTAVATVVSLVVPGATIRRPWVMSIAVGDIVAVALFRDSVFSDIQGSSLLIIFPVVWLSSVLSARLIPVAVVGAFFVTFFPYARSGNWPVDPGEWANVLLMPIVMSFVALATFHTARKLRQHQRSLDGANNALRESVKRAGQQAAITRAAADAVDVGIFFIDPQHQIRSTNVAMQKILDIAGYDPERRAGGAVFEADRSTPVAEDEQNLNRLRRGEDIDERLQWLGPEGNQQAIMSRSSPVIGPGGEFIGTIFVAHDVTDLANAIAVRDAFLVTVSHELLTPLTSILGYLELIEDANEDGQLGLENELQPLARNATSLNGMINELLAANPSAVRVSVESIDLEQIVRASVDRLRLEAQVSGLSLEYVSFGPLPTEGDAVKLRQVVDNVLSNAIKFSPRGQSVIVISRRAGDNILVSIADNGLGISEEDQHQLFDRFFRSSSAHKNHTRGTGLGLSIVKTIVEAHHGTITVSSTPGEGSTFVISLPAPNPTPDHSAV
ncbi:MAG: sensor histidine kinase [Glaciihabitans sp.]|nr:sensor histidine kinase [Glaciihabitans sp.]